MIHTFIKAPEPDNPFDNIHVKVESDSIQLEELIEAFESYLLASGFVLGNRYLDLVEEE